MVQCGWCVCMCEMRCAVAGDVHARKGYVLCIVCTVLYYNKIDVFGCVYLLQRNNLVCNKIDVL